MLIGSEAQIVNIPDPNFKARLLQSSTSSQMALNGMNSPMKIDANGDGEIQVSEAAAVYKLTVVNANIASLEGIQAFSNIIQLSCWGNQLTTLDLGGMVKIDWLYCQQNNLTQLNITGTTLRYLDCSENSLTSLDLTGHKLLKDLDCTSNLLTALDLSPATIYLNFVKCGSNPYTELDLTENTSIKRLDCSNTGLTSIDLSPVSQLLELNIDGTQISSIDLTGLADLSIFTCSNTPIGELDLTPVDLSRLECANTEINFLE